MPITSNLQLDDAPTSTINIEPLERSGGSSYSVSQKRGRVAGVGTTVPGAGIWSKLKGSMNFKAVVLEKSATYNGMRKAYGIRPGLAGLWSWLGSGANVSAHREEIQKMMGELSQQAEANGRIEIDTEVAGLPTSKFPIDVSVYFLALQVDLKQGSRSSFIVASTENRFF